SLTELGDLLIGDENARMLANELWARRRRECPHETVDGVRPACSFVILGSQELAILLDPARAGRRPVFFRRRARDNDQREQGERASWFHRVTRPSMRRSERGWDLRRRGARRGTTGRQSSPGCSASTRRPPTRWQ